ncbi:hypothetical protein SRABI106_02366 [Rahnella aquatilis]|nr:hypothetical protein SRABI106_02366 [Rahnella aquatilis]
MHKADRNFAVDTRQEHGAETATRPRLRNPHPAGTAIVMFVFAIPRELNFDAAIFVRVDFF